MSFLGALHAGNTHGSASGITDMTKSEKVFGIFNSLGAILFAYSFSMILPEIQVGTACPGHASPCWLVTISAAGCRATLNPFLSREVGCVSWGYCSETS